MSQDLAVINHEREKLELIKQTVAKGATDLELQMFMHACQRTGLDPLMKQIYAIKRWSNVDQKEVMSFQTGIDGYRLIADRTGCYAGSDEPKFQEDEQGLWKATVTVWKLVKGSRCAFTASAIWDEYVQTTKEGKPTSMWLKMKYLMLSKCAEALALRKAFPAELSGVYTHEEMMQADTAPHPATPSLPPAAPLETMPPDELATPDVDITILFNDIALEIQNATDVRSASQAYNAAVDAGTLPKGKMDALKVVMQERLGQLKAKR